MKQNKEQTKKKIYISGAISDNPDYKQQFENKYKELEETGSYIILTPLFITAALSWEDYMTIDYAMVKVADCIYMMNGWEKSKGANAELNLAKILGKEIIYENENKV